MIVPMQKVTVIMPVEDRHKAVELLRTLGVMHVEDSESPNSEKRSGLESRLGELARFKNILESLKVKESVKSSDLDGVALYDAIGSAVDEQGAISKSVDLYTQWLKVVKEWGDFDFAQVKAMEERGLYLYLCIATSQELSALKRAGYLCEELPSVNAKRQRFVVVSDHELEANEVPEVKFPTELSMTELEDKLSELKKQQQENLAQLKELAQAMSSLSDYQDSVQEDLDFIIVQGSVGDYGQLSTLSGYVPEPDMEKLRLAAKGQGWGLHFRAADPEKELVPTLLKQSRCSKLINPLMDFLAITPGYNELDVSVPVLIFFTIFFGILAGDAGYGILFLIISGVFYYLKRDNKSMKLAMALMMVLSCSSIVWGALSANWFGMDLLPGLPFLTDEPVKDRNVQLVCFSLALIHLSSARIWRIFASNGNWHHIVGNIGWLSVLVGNFLLVMELLLFPGKIAMGALVGCYASGVLLIAIGDINWKDIGSVFGFPFEVVSSFVDVLSYIRLFAVGLAGYYLAVCFNDMAVPLLKEPSTIIVGIVMLLLGHLLNIALAALGVLVHGVRLNTLEYSNHLGLRWAGYLFKPFSKKDKKIEN